MAVNKAQTALGGEDDLDAALGESRSQSTELAVARPSFDSSQTALASIALRLDALTNATALLRNSVNDRLTDYSEQALRAQSAGNRDLEDFRRLQDRSIANLEAGLTASEEALARLEHSTAEAMSEVDRITHHFDERLDRVQELIEETARGAAAEPADLAPVLEQLESLAGQSARLSSHVDALVDRSEVDLAPVHQALAGIEEVLDGLAQRPDAAPVDLTVLEQALAGMQDALEVVASRPDHPPVDLAPLQSTLAEIQQVLEGVAARPEPIADVATIEQGLSRMQAAVDALADRPVADLTTLHQGLDELHEAVADLAARPDAPAPPEILAALARLERAIAGVSPSAGREAGSAIPSDDIERVLTILNEMVARQDSAGVDLAAMSKAQQTTTRSQLAALSDLQDRLGAIEEATEDREEDADLEANLRDVVGEIVGRLDAATMAIADEVQSVTRSVDALRRRMAVRARNESTLNESAISALADAVARRLSESPAPSAPAADVPRASARRRGTRA